MKAQPLLDYQSELRPVWCPGCGDHNVLVALMDALLRAGVEAKDLVVVSGIGCSGRLPYFIKGYGFHTVHGRALPVATGVKSANPALTVIAVGGDGDGLGIGGGHLPHTARRNPDITYLLLDNGIYGQTKGQPSPTTPQGAETVTSPYGSLEAPLNPILLALSQGASFVAQGFAAATHHEGLTKMIGQGMQHKGFAFIRIISPCVTFNPRATYRHFQSRVVDVPGDHNPSDLRAALSLALEPEKIPLGVLYQVQRPTLEEGLEATRAKAGARGQLDLAGLLEGFA